MKKLSRNSVSLFVAVLSVAAFVGPSMASAANWTPAGTHTITSPAVSIAIGAVGGGWVCHAAFVTDANGTATLTVTSATFTNCAATGSFAGCPVDAVAVNTPMWSASGTTANVSIANVNVNNVFTSGCTFAGSTINVAGTLTGATLNNATHSLSLTPSMGLVGTLAGSSLGPLSIDGALTDTSNTLVLS